MTFKTLFEEQTGFNPFEHVIIASACNRDLRTNRMIPNSVASEPVNGWQNQINQSLVAKEWLHYCDYQLHQQALEALSDQDLADHDMMARAYPNHVHPLHHHVQHVDNAREYRIPSTRFTVDGYHEDTHTMYEFHGCFWYGCRSCYPVHNESHLRLNHQTMDDVCANTQRKINLLKARGYQVIETWECQWRELKSTSPEIATFVASLELIQPLNPRDAFCGGRTNAVQMYHHVGQDEKIHYIDYTSLYPFINKTGVYSKGHPNFISQPGHTDISQYFGFVQCKVLPARQLYHPVLPYREHGKLTFPLCGLCPEREMWKPMLNRTCVCPHTDDARALVGTWCTPELEKAMELGYEIMQINEVWHFPEEQEGLFKDYVNQWLKIKQEASGWPEWVGNDEAKRQQYIRDYEEREGIKLEYHKIQKNPGLRALAKMMLNSMWGKFSQRLNKTQVHEFDDPEQCHKFLDSDAVDVRNVSVINDQLV